MFTHLPDVACSLEHAEDKCILFNVNEMLTCLLMNIFSISGGKEPISGHGSSQTEGMGGSQHQLYCTLKAHHSWHIAQQLVRHLKTQLIFKYKLISVATS